MSRSFQGAGAVLSVLCLAFGAACDLVDYKPSGEPEATSGTSPIQATIDFAAPGDTLALFGNEPRLQYTFTAENGELEIISVSFDGKPIGAAKGGEELKLILDDVPAGLTQLRVEARFSFGEGAPRLYRKIVGEWPVYVEKRAPAAPTVQASLQEGYVTVTWSGEMRRAQSADLLVNGHLRRTFPVSTRQWVDSLYLGGIVQYTIRLHNPLGYNEGGAHYSGAATTMRYEPKDGLTGDLVFDVPEGVHPSGFTVERNNGSWANLGELDGAQRRMPIQSRIGASISYRGRLFVGDCSRPGGCTWRDLSTVFVAGGVPVVAAERYLYNPVTGSYYALGAGLSRFEISDLTTELATVRGVRLATISPEGRLFTVASGAVATVQERDPQSLAVVRTFDLGSFSTATGTPLQLAAAAEGVVVLFAPRSGSERELLVANLDTGTRLGVLNTTQVQGVTLQVSHDARRIWMDSRLLERNDEGKIVTRYATTGHTASYMTPIEDLRYLFTTSGPLRRIDPFQGGAQVGSQIDGVGFFPTLDPATGHVGVIQDHEFSTDLFRVYDLTDGSLKHTIPAHGFWKPPSFDNTIMRPPLQLLGGVLFYPDGARALLLR